MYSKDDINKLYREIATSIDISDDMFTAAVGEYESLGKWRDMHCRIEGSEVNTLQRIFLKMWKKVSGQNVCGSKYYRGFHNAEYIKGLKASACGTSGDKMVGIINREPRSGKEVRLRLQRVGTRRK